MKRVAIFLNQCLPMSEIFVAHQARALSRYKPHLVAAHTSRPSVKGDLPATILHKRGPVCMVREALFKLTGKSAKLEKACAKADVIHAHFGPAGWLARDIALRTGKPLIVTLHGYDVLKRMITKEADGRLQEMYAEDRATLAQRASLFICVSEYVRQRAIEFGFPAEKCVVHYMGIPLHEHTTPKASSREGEPVRLLAVGRLVPFKGHKHLIDMMHHLEKMDVDVRLDIVGNGELMPELKKRAEGLANCHFHGAVPYDGVQAMMRNADIFCHTSLLQKNGQTEAFGLVLLEAQYAGLPVVAFASGGVPEALQDGVTGFLCEERDTRAFAAHIKELAYDRQKRQEMSNAAQAFVREKFDNTVLTGQLEDIYDRVVQQHGAQTGA